MFRPVCRIWRYCRFSRGLASAAQGEQEDKESESTRNSARLSRRRSRKEIRQCGWRPVSGRRLPFPHRDECEEHDRSAQERPFLGFESVRCVDMHQQQKRNRLQEKKPKKQLQNCKVRKNETKPSLEKASGNRGFFDLPRILALPFLNSCIRIKTTTREGRPR